MYFIIPVSHGISTGFSVFKQFYGASAEIQGFRGPDFNDFIVFYKKFINTPGYLWYNFLIVTGRRKAH